MLTGIHAISEAEYRAIDAVNQSSLKHILRSPAHYQAGLRRKHEPTTALTLGSALHCVLLEPAEFESRFIVAPEDVGTRASKAYKDFEASAEGRTILKLDEMEKVNGMLEAVTNQPRARELLTKGKSELSLVWEDAQTKLKCKGKLDWLTEGGVIVDVKTTKSAEEWSFQKSIYDYMYHFQAAFYIDGLATVSGAAGLIQYKFICVETEPPFGVRVYSLREEAIDVGRMKVRDAMDRLAMCLHDNVWPGYISEETGISIPRWALNSYV